MARLQRLEWIYTTSPVYFITACMFGRRTLLANAKVHDAFRTFAEPASSRGVWVGCYVLMPDHIHLFAAFSGEGPDLSGWVRSLKGYVSGTLRRASVRPPHWQKGFFDHVLRSEESYKQKWEYVRQNPVRAGLVDHEGEWPYQGEIYPLGFR